MVHLLKLPHVPELAMRRYRLKARHIMAEVDDGGGALYISTKTSLRQMRAVLRNLQPLIDGGLAAFDVPVCLLVRPSDTESDAVDAGSESEDSASSPSVAVPVLVGAVRVQALRRFVRRAVVQVQRSALAQQWSVRALLDTRVDVLHALRTLMAANPTTFAPSASMPQVHRLFVVLRLSNAFVTRHGVLVGILTRQIVADAVAEHGKRPLRPSPIDTAASSSAATPATRRRHVHQDDPAPTSARSPSQSQSNSHSQADTDLAVEVDGDDSVSASASASASESDERASDVQ